MNPYISAPKNLLYFSLFLHFLFPVVAISRISLPFIYKYRSFFTWFYFFQNFLKIFSWILFYTFLKIFFSRLQILKLRNLFQICCAVFVTFLSQMANSMV